MITIFFIIMGIASFIGILTYSTRARSAAEENYRLAVIDALVLAGIPKEDAVNKVRSFKNIYSLRSWEVDGCFMEVGGTLWAYGRPTKFNLLAGEK